MEHRHDSFILWQTSNSQQFNSFSRSTSPPPPPSLSLSAYTTTTAYENKLELTQDDFPPVDMRMLGVDPLELVSGNLSTHFSSCANRENTAKKKVGNARARSTSQNEVSHN